MSYLGRSHTEWNNLAIQKRPALVAGLLSCYHNVINNMPSIMKYSSHLAYQQANYNSVNDLIGAVSSQRRWEELISALHNVGMDDLCREVFMVTTSTQSSTQSTAKWSQLKDLYESDDIIRFIKTNRAKFDGIWYIQNLCELKGKDVLQILGQDSRIRIFIEFAMYKEFNTNYNEFFRKRDINIDDLVQVYESYVKEASLSTLLRCGDLTLEPALKYFRSFDSSRAEMISGLSKANLISSSIANQALMSSAQGILAKVFPQIKDNVKLLEFMNTWHMKLDPVPVLSVSLWKNVLIATEFVKISPEIQVTSRNLDSREILKLRLVDSGIKFTNIDKLIECCSKEGISYDDIPSFTFEDLRLTFVNEVPAMDIKRLLSIFTK